MTGCRVAAGVMSTSPRKLCRRHGLVYIETSELDLRRRKCGKGFSYIDITNRIVRDKALKARIKTLAIPPAWTDVRIASNERAHIQAIGRDSEGRLQYRYHPEWEIIRDETKRRRLLSFGNSLSRVRSAVRSALSKPGLGPTKVVAAVVRLMDKALLRPGHEPYAGKEGGRGAATLNKDDVTVRGDTILLDFAGKGGKEVKLQVKDALLARALRQLRKVPGRRLFSLPERPVTAQEVNTFLAEVSGTEITAKDFRTFRASAEAVGALVEGEASEETNEKKALISAADHVSQALANTSAVARSSYIHPNVFEAFESGKLKSSLSKNRLVQGLSRFESALLRLLRSNAG